MRNIYYALTKPKVISTWVWRFYSRGKDGVDTAHEKHVTWVEAYRAGSRIENSYILNLVMQTNQVVVPPFELEDRSDLAVREPCEKQVRLSMKSKFSSSFSAREALDILSARNNILKKGVVTIEDAKALVHGVKLFPDGNAVVGRRFEPVDTYVNTRAKFVEPMPHL